MKQGRQELRATEVDELPSGSLRRIFDPERKSRFSAVSDRREDLVAHGETSLSRCVSEEIRVGASNQSSGGDQPDAVRSESTFEVWGYNHGGVRTLRSSCSRRMRR
jgi:hypothetical protein